MNNAHLALLDAEKRTQVQSIIDEATKFAEKEHRKKVGSCDPVPVPIPSDGCLQCVFPVVALCLCLSPMRLCSFHCFVRNGEGQT